MDDQGLTENGIKYWQAEAALASKAIDAAYEALDAANDRFAFCNDAIRTLRKKDEA